MLGDDDRILESSRYLVTNTRNMLDDASNDGRSLPTAELAWMRRNLAWIANQLGSGLELRDEERIPEVLTSARELIERIDAYPGAQ